MLLDNLSTKCGVWSAGVELEQGARWGCGGEGRREQSESSFLCLWEVDLLVQFYKMLPLSRSMGKWYPNKSHRWRNHVDASMGRPLGFSLEVTSSSSLQSSCRGQTRPGSHWCHFPGCFPALTLFPALRCQPTLLCRGEGLLKSQKRLPSLTSAMQKSLNSSLLTSYG